MKKINLFLLMAAFGFAVACGNAETSDAAEPNMKKLLKKTMEEAPEAADEAVEAVEEAAEEAMEGAEEAAEVVEDAIEEVADEMSEAADQE